MKSRQRAARAAASGAATAVDLPASAEATRTRGVALPARDDRHVPPQDAGLAVQRLREQPGQSVDSPAAWRVHLGEQRARYRGEDAERGKCLRKRFVREVEAPAGQMFTIHCAASLLASLGVMPAHHNGHSGTGQAVAIGIGNPTRARSDTSHSA